MNIDRVSSIIANVLYAVDRMKMPVSKAFVYVCNRFGCGAAGVGREELFKLSRDFISSYYRIRYIIESVGGGHNPSYRMMAKVYLYLMFREEGGIIPSRLRKSVQRGLPNIDSIEVIPAWARLSYPRWLYERLLDVLPSSDVEELLEAMNKENVWIRVNTLKIDVDRALRNLEMEGVVLERDRDIPFLARVIKSGKPIRDIELFKNGSIIVQDRASVLTVLAARPERNMIVYDFAAAPGVKASLIMQLTENSARIVAMDLSIRRLNSMKLLLKHYGVDVSKIDLIHTDSKRIVFGEKADLALVDAACSNSGAVSKDPSVKILLRDQSLPIKMKSTQIDMLLNALRHSYTTIYSVCSILPEEGEEVVDRVSKNASSHKLVDTGLKISRGYRKYDVWNVVSRTFPHIDKCEGFFIARFEY
ncbi:MAG: RsmB/NOP family class I SAM-dependent RNA methyltransferase [Ignisphaera sp.]|nr:RsmB/NOP family class I SAM-dependent RNA methyltransferase [Ignisphaera sp.]MDW8085640.1 RsmB/NOP family class I SAM-dependent RNA methyltransferase [Ignisphaera sp.]